MNDGSLLGVVVPVITPTDEEDRVDEPSFRALLRHLIGSGVHGLFVGGSAGEGPLLAPEEWRRMIRIAHDEVAGAVSVIGGAMDTSTARIIGRLKELAEAGYRYGVVAPSFYVALTSAAEHSRLFRDCARAVPEIELVAYNIPACTSSQIPVEVLCGLAGDGIVQYCKDSSGDLEYLRELISAGGARGLKVLVGAEDCIAAALQSGAVGVVPACANFEPQTFLRAWAAATRQDWIELEEVQARISELRKNVVLGGSNWVSGLKHAVAARGHGAGSAVSPLEPLSSREKASIESFLSAAGS